MAIGTEHLEVGPRDHVVEFYHSDDELAEHVGGYLLDAVCDGSMAIVIATAAHRQAFEARLADAGVDVGTARSSGALLTLDASDALHAIVTADRPDPAGFELLIGQLIRQATEAGRRVRVYGEIVALLWDAGQVNAAIELEALWNELSRQYPFSLFCAYPAHSVTDDHLTAFAEVCHLHVGMIGVPPADPGLQSAHTFEETNTFSASSDGPRAARRFVTEMLRQRGAGEIAPDAGLLVTELATNAVVHARSGFTVAVSARGAAVRIAVRDTSPLPGADPHAPLTAAPTRGLGIVAAVAGQWGTELLGDEGKTVWAELHR